VNQEQQQRLRDPCWRQKPFFEPWLVQSVLQCGVHGPWQLSPGSVNPVTASGTAFTS